MSIEQDFQPSRRQKFPSLLDRIEEIYLKVLRAIVLIVATAMIGYALWLLASGMYRISRDPTSVDESVAAVISSDLVDSESAAIEKSAPNAATASIDNSQRNFYNDFTKRYFVQFSERFEPYRQAEDKKLSRDQFDDRFVGTQRRLDAIKAGELNFAEDRRDLEALLAVMTESASAPKTVERLGRYQKAKKIAVQRIVERTRTERRSGWDSGSMTCQDWYVSPYGCPTVRLVEIPYSEAVSAMEFPKGTQSYIAIFEGYQSRYFELLDKRRTASRAAAENERASIESGQIVGSANLLTSLQIVVGFLALMFFFLLIAIERHQRKMVANHVL